ncbi:hypothetical protein FRB96_007621 [Tulasnella sp. 330]|nr:hypothetical protein FRB96_007621 [Tulasnella sp. 330]KAG8880060.1 hypothetical protein FRB97_001105 [Tulasnella sp. 331]KAG8886692.1 hypothetical protein FRB98_001096 [Tulasnella sp. 332]
MTDAAFGLVTSMFTIGGLVGSLSSGAIMNKFGRKGAVRINALTIGLGSVMMMLAWGFWTLLIGRSLVGVGAGIAMCVGPVYLAEIAPHNIKGSVGVLNQVSVVIGILLAQTAGLFLSAPNSHLWRAVFFISAALSAIQILLSAGFSDTPLWLTSVGREIEAKTVAGRLWKKETALFRAEDEAEAHINNPENESLLAGENADDAASVKSDTNIPALSVLELFKLEPLRRPVSAIVLVMLAQQLSGINSVMFYSNKILANVIPGKAGYISLGISALNVIMTFPAIYLIERLGRRHLLFGSMMTVLTSLLFIAVGLNENMTVLSSVAILAFVGFFAIGLGPVPFVLIGELVPFYAASSTSSLALSVNWLTNFVIGVGFLPLRGWLTTGEGPDRKGDGNVFLFFAVTYAIVFFAFWRVWR